MEKILLFLESDDFLIIHIVRPHENLAQIAASYHILETDIISNNLHVTDFNRLVAGTKLKIPFLSTTVTDTLEETESFIRDYYPTFDGKLKSLEEDELPKVEPKKKDDDLIPPLEKESIEEKTATVSIPSVNDSINVVENAEKKEPKLTVDNNYKLVYGAYCGNVIPSIPSKYIRKI